MESKTQGVMGPAPVSLRSVRMGTEGRRNRGNREDEPVYWGAVGKLWDPASIGFTCAVRSGQGGSSLSRAQELSVTWAEDVFSQGQVLTKKSSGKLPESPELAGEEPQRSGEGPVT